MWRNEKPVFRDKTKIAKFTNDMSLENIPCTVFHEGWGKWVGEVGGGSGWGEPVQVLLGEDTFLR